MKEKLYCLPMIAEQKKIHTEYCFGSKCGKIQIGAIVVMDIPCHVCMQPKENCPAFDKEMNEPIGEVEDGFVYMRKLKEEKK